MIINGTAIRMIRGDTEVLTVSCEQEDGTPRPFVDGDTVYLTAVSYTHLDVYKRQAKALAQKSITSSLGNNGELQSQTVGSWSKTYRSGGDSAQQALSSVQAAQSALTAIAQQYLAGTGLLYRGRGCCCGYVPPCGDDL